MSFNKSLSFILLSVLSFGVSAQSDSIIEKTISSFSKLKVSGRVAIELIPSDKTKITLSAKDARNLEIEVEGDWLEIEPLEEEKGEHELIVSELKSKSYLKDCELEEEELEEIYEELTENVVEEKEHKIAFLIEEVLEELSEKTGEKIQKDSASIRKFADKIELVVDRIVEISEKIEQETEEKIETSFWNKWFKKDNSKRFTLTIYYKDLKHLILEEGVALKSKKPIKNSDLILELETGTSFKSDLIAKNLAFELSTGSSAKIGGLIEKAEISVSTGSILKASNLFAQRLYLDVATGSQTKINLTKPSEKITLDVSTGSNVTLNIADVESILGNISTSSTVTLKGKAKQQGFNINTSSTLDASELKTKVAILKVNHSSEANVHVSQMLDAVASHSSEISYRGTPKSKKIKEKYSSEITGN